jgi:hypothetical protein
VQRRSNINEFLRDLKIIYDYRKFHQDFLKLPYLNDVNDDRIGKVCAYMPMTDLHYFIDLID